MKRDNSRATRNRLDQNSTQARARLEMLTSRVDLGSSKLDSSSISTRNINDSIRAQLNSNSTQNINDSIRAQLNLNSTQNTNDSIRVQLNSNSTLIINIPSPRALVIEVHEK